MRRMVKYLVAKTYRPLLVQYLSRTRTYSTLGFVLQVPSGVFHPGFFTSTKLLLRCLARETLLGRKVLELGAGSGLLSLYATSRGARVLATDISPLAVETVRRNARANGVRMEVIQSDLFQNLGGRQFDLVLINPPYYRKNAKSLADRAWFCGAEGEYFQGLFAGLASCLHANSRVLMVLCSGCDLAMIRGMAEEQGYCLRCICRKDNLLEKNFVYLIERSHENREPNA